MKPYLNLAIFVLWASVVKAGQLISAYNLISPHQVVFPQPQTYSPPSIGIVHPQYFSSLRPQEPILVHPTVLATSIEESSVPNSLRKSEHFYNNPYVASALAKESLNFNKETVVYDRPSEKIDRHQIAKLINNLNRVHHESK